jgi:diacylglycerol kinase (ATP)
MPHLPLLDALRAELRRIGRAFGYSLDGLRAAWGERAFRTEALLCIVAAPIAFGLAKSGVELALLIGSLLLVLVVELLNTGIEDAINRISTDIHPLSKRAKDMGSAAVFLALLGAACVWLAVLWK